MTRVFVEERDKFLAHNLHTAAETPLPYVPPRQGAFSASGADGDSGAVNNEKRVVVGVVGIGHAKGIEQHWGQVSLADAQAVCAVPPPSLVGKAISHVAKFTFYSALLFGAYKIVSRKAPDLVSIVTRKLT